jgi:multicomponent Na+:H+ antiporter subunit E
MEKTEPKHILYKGIVFAMLMATWLVLSGLFDAFHLTLGVISCGLVTWMSSDILFENRSQSLRSRLVQAGRLMGYLGWLLWQIFLSNLHLFRLAFSPMSEIQPHIVRYESKLDTDFQRFLLANSITLTPGTVTIKIMGDTFYIHAISDIAAQGLDGEMERRIHHIFSTEPSTSTAEA